MFFYRIMLFETNILSLLKFLPSRKLQLEKSKLRELLKQKRRILSKEQVVDDSALILQQLEEMPCFKEASTVMIYYPTHNEVDLRPLIKKYRRTKTFLFPVVHRRSMNACPYKGNDHMHRGKFNIPEPTTDPYKGIIDLIILPGVAFDKNGNRLGQGGGYYDRFLASANAKSILIGVAYDFQLVDKIPSNRKDKKMDYVIFPTKGVVKRKRD